MKRSRVAGIVLLLGGAPLHTLAQTASGPVTRAAVIEHLVDVERAGFLPTQASSLRFPFNVEAAEARVAAQHATRSSEPRTDTADEAQTVEPPR
ncbi:DUF4148 domain-containing protein [Paraburkholderia acidisoli]|uniref:DUF4148 domain-containing protein n=1 Tax=Paraburkholderia acidisoli TaxID=2571748 RepID=A0A7Z2GJY3_9BURK|nr:DUF4148 domain-containing protein [Paraburkholderia acidisoli]QGZ63101.1 DUF4148 domain-containing protein [Paraburkholderia acidisoli]